MQGVSKSAVRRLGLSCLTALLVLTPLIASAQAPINAESNGVLTTVLKAFLATFQNGYNNLLPWAQTLFYLLVGIELVWAALYWSLEGENFIPQLISKVFFIGVFYYLVINWSSLAHQVVTGFVQVGAQAGGVAGTAVPDLQDPSQLINQFWNLAAPIATYQASLPWYSIGKAMMFGFAYLILAAAIIVIAIQCALTYLEFYLISVIAAILVPFGVNKHLSFLAERSFGAVISNGVKTAVLAFILASAGPIIASLTPPGAAPSYADVFNLDAAVCLVAFLAWHAPGLAASLMGGGPTLHAGHITRAAGSTAGYLLGSAIAGGSAGRTSIQSVRAAAGAIGRSAVGVAGAAGQVAGAVRTGATQAATAGSGPIGQTVAGAAAAGRLAGRAAASPLMAAKDAGRRATAALREAYTRGEAAAVRATARKDSGQS
jgi:type IV secretion system protein TrbL